ncbi:hypothetical protein ACLMJK_000951 [Lecanora helva]
MGNSFSKVLDELIVKQADVLTNKTWWHRENKISECAIINYFARFIRIREQILSHRHRERPNRWNQQTPDFYTCVDDLMGHLLRLLDISVSDRPVKRTLPPLEILVDITNMEKELGTKHHFGKYIEDIYRQRLTALSFALYSIDVDGVGKVSNHTTEESAAFARDNPSRTPYPCEESFKDLLIRELDSKVDDLRSKLEASRAKRDALAEDAINLKREVRELRFSRFKADVHDDIAIPTFQHSGYVPPHIRDGGKCLSSSSSSTLASSSPGTQASLDLGHCQHSVKNTGANNDDSS